MYSPLHNRSAYSFGSALTMPEQLVDFAVEHDLPAVALTDRAGLYAAVGFQQACQRAGIKPIFGTELPLTDGITVTLLAQTLRGYGHLCRLISLHHLRNDEARSDDAATLTIADLCEHAEDVICIVGHAPDRLSGSRISDFKSQISNLNSEISNLRFQNSGPNSQPSTLNSQLSTFPSHLSRLTSHFRDRLYIELAPHAPDDLPVARRRAAMADSLGIPVVATGESRCPRRDQATTLRALASIGTLTLLDQPHPDKPEGHWHLRTPEEMARQFKRRPDALANTLRVAEQCNVRLDTDISRFPACDAPDGRSPVQHLRELCIAGCRRRYVERPPQRGIGGVRPTLAQALERLERELTIIEQVRYAEYFLVFHEIADYCRQNDIAILARGSAADSLVCYALGVSHACPFRFDLPFDRFLNPERAKFSKMADIDLDLPWDQRDQVVRWVYDRWGYDRVAMIGSPNTFHGRAAVAELGKVFGLPPQEVNQITKRLPRTTAWNLARAIAHSPETRDLPIQEEPYRTIVRMAAAFEGLPRHWSMHPCGLVVSPEPLTDLVPVQRSPKGPLVAQYDMDAIEDLGFIKIDLLGQAGLSVLRDTLDEIERTDGVRVDFDRDVDYSDEATWDMIANGRARGVHHIESPAMTSLITQCNCRDIDCLTTIVAVIRPGAANQGKKDLFARRYQGLETASYAHPSLEPVLEKTFGLMVFEEHILQIATEFAGMNLGRADVLRRALNKENRSMIREMKGEFRDAAREVGRSEAEIEAVWPMLEGFAGFMFNKAHSAEYAVEAFQGAWLKRRRPAHYLAAILSNYRGFYATSPTLPQILYVMEARRLGIGFLPPCVNRSRRRFAVEYRGDLEPIPKPGNHTGETPVPQWFWDALSMETPAPNGVHESHCSRSSGTREKLSAISDQRSAGGGRSPSIPAQASASCATSNRSSPTLHSSFFTLHSSDIRLPVTHIQGLTQEFLDRYLAEREKGPFASLADFVRRCRPGEAASRLLLDSGALDCFGSSRPGLFWQLRKLSHRHPAARETLFRDGHDDAPENPPVALTEPDDHRIAQREMELLGFPVTIDPLTFLGTDDKGRTIDWSRYTPVARLGAHLTQRVTVCGLMVADRVNTTTGGDLMKFVTLADRTGFVETHLFPDAYRRFGHLTVAHPILAATGIVDPFENGRGFTLRIERVAPPEQVPTPV